MKEKMETFFFIPLMGLQTCIVPVLSFNYATKSYGRCRETMKDSYLFSCGFMLIGGVFRVLSGGTAPDLFGQQ